MNDLGIIKEMLLSTQLKSGGSETSEIAIRLSRLYNRIIGKRKKNLIVSRKLSYHGGTLLSMGVSEESGYKKSSYKPETISQDNNVDVKTIVEATDFLNTFFKIYPKVSIKELEYYVSSNTLKPINQNLVFVELINSVFIKENRKLSANITVK